ncbi:MAG: rRNA pseudouridine synthase [Gammaproteobacteria bacterium]|nr:rRNA pseudouridine synthase [Gammaproteobacteria bacterium]MCF6231373.1 rRNA pseudouridine synthase [Gammaproteobacteria bacterium]
MSEPIRLDKRLVALIQCSRGEAQKYIEGGWVRVDGEMVDQPQFKVTSEKIELHTNATLTPVIPATILFHQQDGYDLAAPAAALPLITPQTRSMDDGSGITLLKRHLARQRPTVPLESGATGLLVFSQDGRILRRLIDDASKNEQEYVVEVAGEIAADGIDLLNQPMMQEGWQLPSAKVSWQSDHCLRFALKNVRPGQIEYMCQQVGLNVVSMLRIRIGRVSMGKLKPGEWRYLPSGSLF